MEERIQWVSECVELNVQLGKQHFGDESFQTIDCTDTDSQTDI